jgi:hypothetical protein
LEETQRHSPESSSTWGKGEATQANSEMTIPYFAGFGFQPKDFEESMPHWAAQAPQEIQQAASLSA